MQAATEYPSFCGDVTWAAHGTAETGESENSEEHGLQSSGSSMETGN